MEQIAAVSGICKQYGGVQVLKNISFTLNRGDTLGYLGPNGSGKTTTLKAMLGLVRYDSGAVSILLPDKSTRRFEKNQIAQVRLAISIGG